MAITGIHMLLYSPEADALRGFFKDTLGYDHVDAGEGWLIFKLPPAELGIHPAEGAKHEMSFMCDDIEATVSDLRDSGVVVKGEPTDVGFGIEVGLQLPGGVDVLLYEPRHPTAI